MNLVSRKGRYNAYRREVAARILATGAELGTVAEAVDAVVAAYKEAKLLPLLRIALLFKDGIQRRSDSEAVEWLVDVAAR